MTFSRLALSKKTHTYADTLLAVGWADLLSECLGTNIQISDNGSHFLIESDRPFTLQEIENTSISPGYKYVADKNDNMQSLSGEVFDYERERQKRQVYQEFQKTTGKNQQETQALENPPPPPDINLQNISILSSMRKGFKADKQLHQLIAKNPRRMGSIIARRINSLQASGLSAAREEKDEKFFAGKISNCQFFNPITGKGVIRPKPNGTTLASYPKNEVDWFEEWMKFRGMYKSLMAYRSGEDFKIYVIEPGRIPLFAIDKLRRLLLKANLWGGIKLDIRAILTLAKIMILHSREYDPHKGVLSFLQGESYKTPKQIIHGLHQAFFKNLGTAAALMNYSFLALPGWFPIKNQQSALAFLAIIEEHLGEHTAGEHKMGCLDSLREDRSDDIPLLTRYRDFLSSGQLSSFLEFAVLFATHIMQQREERKAVKQLSTTNLRRLFVMGYEELNLKEIVENQGFLNIAAAIRRATVNAQYRKSHGSQVWDIHYGLAQEWKRQLKFKERFVTALAEFAQKYNAENARHAEQGKERRKNITSEDLNQVMELIEKRGSELTGMLLLAYGYASTTGENPAPAAEQE